MAQESFPEMIERLESNRDKAVPEKTIETDTRSKRLDLSLIPNRFYEEAEGFKRECERDFRMRTHYNCACLASSFFERRIEAGPDEHPSVLKMDVEGMCIEATQAAGAKYENCLQDVLGMPDDQDPDAYCTCIANTYATLFETYQLKPTSRNTVRIKTQATIMCRDPVVARRLFPATLRNLR